MIHGLIGIDSIYLSTYKLQDQATDRETSLCEVQLLYTVSLVDKNTNTIHTLTFHNVATSFHTTIPIHSALHPIRRLPFGRLAIRLHTKH